MTDDSTINEDLAKLAPAVEDQGNWLDRLLRRSTYGEEQAHLQKPSNEPDERPFPKPRGRYLP